MANNNLASFLQGGTQEKPQEQTPGNLGAFLQQAQAQPQQETQYPNPPQSMADQLAAMPNSEKLTGFERWVYNKLPGVGESRIGKLLETFGNSPVGKALNYLDVFAEGAERALGTIAQLKYRQPDEQIDWADAWKAGSLYYDVSNLPTVNGGQVQIESDLPGTYALVEARKLMEQGASFEEVRDTLYNNLGALRLRAQLQDTMGHVILDPLNYVSAFVKPVQKLTALRNLALSGKVDVSVAENIASALREAGKIEDAVKVEQALADAQKTGKAMTWADRAIIRAFGGVGYYGEESSKLSKVIGKVTGLTPEAKTHELMDMAEKNVYAYLINKSDNPEEFIQNMSAVARGSVGGEWGHIALTPQGRAVQGIFNYADASVRALGQEWKLYSKERNVLQQISQLVGMDANKVWDMARKNPEELSRLITKTGLGMSSDTIKQVANIPDAATSAEKFFAHAAARIEDSAAQIGVLKFGVQPKKFVTRLSDVVKKYETLAFIKLNPANMVRNAINNEVTLIARGLYSVPFDKGIKEFWKGKYMPELLKRGFNAAGDGLDEEYRLASRTIGEALNGNGGGILDKAGRLADNFDAGVLDSSKLSQKAEASASIRASTNAFIEFGNNYWNPRTGFTSVSKYLDSDIMDALNAIDPNFARTLDDVAQASGGDVKKFRELLGKDLEINSSSVFQAVEENLGFKVGDVLGPEMTHMVSEGLPDAIRNGRVQEFVDGLRVQMEKHVDDLFNENVKNIPDIVSTYVQAGGPPQFSRLYSRVMDEFWAGNSEHAVRMSTLNELIDYAKSTGDYTKVNSLWRKVFEDGQNHFNRLWKKMDAYEQGMKEGAKAAGIPYPQEIGNGFKDMRKGWSDFFTMRDKEYEAFFSADLKGQQATDAFNALQNKINTEYAGMIRREDAAYGAIDNALAQMIPDKQVRKMYQNMRTQAAQLRVADRDATAQFYQAVRQVDSSEAPAMWQKFWQEKMSRIQQMRDIEKRGSAMMQGDPNAVAQFAAGADQTVDPNTIRGLASQYGMATRTASGATMDNHILNAIKKYGNPTADQIIDNAKLPDDVKAAFKEYKKFADDLDLQKANQGTELSSMEQLKAAQKAEKEARKKYEEVLKANRIDKKMVDKLIRNKEFMDVETIPMDVARQAFEARAAKKGENVQQAVDKYFIPDAEMQWPEPMPLATGLSELNYGRGYAVMDNIVEEAIGQSKVTRHTLAGLPTELRDKVMRWADNVEAETSAFKSAQFEYAKMRRDSALLNYNRRTNFDNFVGHLAPFAFWTTHSIGNWAIHSIDRPAMLTSYLRYKKLLETAGLENDNLPTRMRGHLRINLPFAPDWLGDQFVNPLGVALPFDAWQQPWQQAQTSQISNQRRTEQTLADMLEKGVINEQQYRFAIDNKEGEYWDIAQSKASEGGDNYDAMDFASAMMTPHAPLLWAYNAARGTPNEIGPFMPISKTARNVATMFGVKDWANSPYNVEGRIRKELGLPAFDRWDDYRVGREISNIAADGDFSYDEVREAMELAAQVEAGQIDSKEAVKRSKVYEEATYRANQEAAGGWAGTILGALGIPIKSLPTGEQKQRELTDKFVAALEARDKGDEEAVGLFFDEHPEYEARLGLFKKPEERLKTYMIDNMWSRWNQLPKVTQNEVKEQLGSTFAEKFLNKETQNYDAITPQQLQIWLKLTGGRNVGQLEATESALIELNQLKLTEPETAWRVQTFYDMRENNTPDWYEMQSDYYDLPEGAARQKFLAENPELKQYWNQRAQWMQRNPDLVKYLTDDPKQLRKYENSRRNPEIAAPTADEIAAQISPANMELLQDWTQGQTLPASTDRYLDMLAQQYGMPKRTLLGILTGNPVQ